MRGNQGPAAGSAGVAAGDRANVGQRVRPSGVLPWSKFAVLLKVRLSVHVRRGNDISHLRTAADDTGLEAA